MSFLALNPLEQNDKLPGNNEIQTQEYSHAYVLADSVDIPAQGVKRISWANSQTIKAKQDFRLFVGGHYLDDMEGKNAYPTTETWISFQNIKEQNQLGSPLPQGDATLYRTDEKGGIEVLGKAAIPHTATGQDVSVKIPQTQAEKSSTNAQDGQALQNLETVLEQTEFKKLGEKITEAGYRLALKNKGNQPITIRVTLDLPKSEWTITRENISHQQNGDQQVFWTIQVGANSSIDLKYRIRLILA